MLTILPIGNFEQEAATKALEMNLTRFKARVISVTPSTNDIAKRQATTIINPASSRSSHSPTPDLSVTNNLEAASASSPASQSSATQTRHHSASDRHTRTIALMNVPDTVTSSRVRALAEPHGALVKVQLRPDHQGAILEYADTASTGKASLALDGYEIAPDRHLRVGIVPDMLKEKAEVKSSRIGDGKKTDAKSLQPSMPIRRPNQPGARRGGRGRLGVKGGGVGLSGGRARNDGSGTDVAMNGASEEGTSEVGGQAKSNADFKAMFLTKN